VHGLHQEVEALERRIQSLQVEVAQAQKVGSRQAEFRTGMELRNQELSDFQRALPNRGESLELMDRIQRLASESNLQITAFVPGKIETKDSYLMWPIQVSLEGNYRNLVVFFERVSSMNWLVNIGEVKLRALQDSTAVERSLNATCTISAFLKREELGV
jgi:type IV pilus assembly protein PilO